MKLRAHDSWSTPLDPSYPYIDNQPSFIFDEGWFRIRHLLHRELHPAKLWGRFPCVGVRAARAPTEQGGAEGLSD